MLKKILFLIEKKAEEFDDKKLLLYVFSFLYLRQVIETSLTFSLRMGTKMVFWESVRLLVLDYPVFFINMFFLIALLISLFSGEDRHKVLKIVFLFTPWILIPPVWDFIFHGGGFRYFYLLKPEEALKNLFSNKWIWYSLGFSQGQFIELAGASILGAVYVFLKGRKIKSILFLPIPFLAVVFLGSPYFLSLKFFGTNVFGDGGFLYYNQDKILIYNIVILIILSFAFQKKNYFKINFKFNFTLFFLISGWLTAWHKTDFHNLIFFDYLSLPLMIFILSIKRKSYLSWFLSISSAFALGHIPFIFFVSCFLFFEEINLNRGLKEFLLSLFAFYLSAGFFLKTRVHLAYPFYYPLLISLIYGIFSQFFYKFRWIPLFLLPFGFLFKGKTLFVRFPSKDVIQNLEEKYYFSKDPAYLYDLWSLYMFKGDFEKVKSITFSLPYEYSPSDYYGKLADFYLLTDRTNEAENFALKSIPIGNPFSLLTLGHIYHIKGNKKALKYLKKAHQMKINPERSFFLLINEYLRQGEREKALKTLEDMKKWNKESPLYKILVKEISE